MLFTIIDIKDKPELECLTYIELYVMDLSTNRYIINFKIFELNTYLLFIVKTSINSTDMTKLECLTHL